MAGECDSLSPPEADYLQVLSDLIEAYETEHHPIGVLPAHVMLAAAMEAKGVNQTEVARATGIPRRYRRSSLRSETSMCRTF
jgi:HTH-type transcriptional regulator / antitoxin HigA